jgi:hypothetical protein
VALPVEDVEELLAGDLLEAFRFITMMVSRSSISSSISYSSVSASGVSTNSTNFAISSRRAWPISRSVGLYSLLSSNVTSVVRIIFSWLGTQSCRYSWNRSRRDTLDGRVARVSAYAGYS